MGSREGGVGKIFRMPFRSSFSQARTTTGETYGRLDLSLANLGDRAGLDGETYEWFRVTRLHVYSYVDSPVMSLSTGGAAAGGSIRHAIAFINSPTASTTAPTTQAQLTQYEHYVTSGPMERIHLRVRRKDLLAEPLKWYNTYNTGSVPANQLSVGQIDYSLAIVNPTTVSSVAQFVIVEGTIEFHTPIASADSMLRVPRKLLADPLVAKAADRLREAVAEAKDSDGST